MEADLDLSEEQQLVLNPSVRLVEACPGAGKTRSIIQRYKALASSSKRGIALLSFTRSAIEEAIHRCMDRPDLLRTPHFIGTFDTFFHRYIVTPSECSRLGKSPTYLQSWDELPKELRQVSAGSYHRIKLSSFTHTKDGETVLIPESLNYKEKLAYESLSSDVERKALLQKGADAIQHFNEAGIYDSDTARLRALQILRGPNGTILLARIANRFTSVIVDEFQDCAALEHDLLAYLRSAGIHVTVVADPDQAIFDFRQAEPRLYADYKSLVPSSEVVTLTTNFRSSDAICTIVQSLRNSSDSKILSGCDQEGLCKSVYLLGGTNENIRKRFMELCSVWKIPLGKRSALAHRRNDAKSLASGGQNPPQSESIMFELLINLATLRGSGSASIRRQAMGSIERLILSLYKWESTVKREGSTAKLELLGKDHLWIKHIVGKLLEASALWADAAAAAASVRQIMSEHCDQLTIPINGKISSKFVKPRDDVWNYWSNRGTGRDQSAEISWSSIHAAKGHEYDAVLLKVPEAAVIEAWIEGQDMEERRVFYVGASRAKKLLVLAVDESRFKTVNQQLVDLEIPVISELLP